MRRHASDKPEQLAVAHLVDDELGEQTLTYGELDRRARSFAAHLQSLVTRGERALLIFPSGLEFIVGYLGCLYAGVIAVPAPVPLLKRSVPRLTRVLADAGAVVICSTLDVSRRIGPALEEAGALGGVRWALSDDIPPGVESRWQPLELSPDDVAFLQYTSGSTSEPRGVMISHGNLIATVHDLQQVSAFDADGVVVTWMPMFHDLGLLCRLLALEAGARGYTLDPVHFLARPYRWLNAVSRYQATHTAAPDSGYALCTQKVTSEERGSLDLRSLRSAVIGSEPVHLSTMTAFAARFGECGFRLDAFMPGYGLAEATVMVSAVHRVSHCRLDPEGARNNQVVLLPAASDGQVSVDCGWSTIGADIRIVNAETRRPCRADEIGEIWVRSASVAQGYFRRPEETLHTFGGRLADGGEGPFLRTGDMGFIHDGGLHVTGRIKDMLIVNGKNFYPHDIELTVGMSHAALEHGAGAAFPVEHAEGQGLVLVQEVNWQHRQLDNPMEVVNRIRMAVAEHNGLRAHAVVLVRPATIPRTTSGKIQRRACKDAFLSGSLEVLFQWTQSRRPGES